MKSQEQRDEETVTIFAGLLLFLLLTALGAVALLSVHQFVALKGDMLNVLVYGVLVAAVAIPSATSSATEAAENVRFCRGE
jgi:hypothetical protein